jgi:hypothetical protein
MAMGASLSAHDAGTIFQRAGWGQLARQRTGVPAAVRPSAPGGWQGSPTTTGCCTGPIVVDGGGDGGGVAGDEGGVGGGEGDGAGGGMLPPVATPEDGSGTTSGGGATGAGGGATRAGPEVCRDDTPRVRVAAGGALGAAVSPAGGLVAAGAGTATMGGGAASWSMAEASPPGPVPRPTVSQPITRQSSACPTTRATAVRTVRRDVRVAVAADSTPRTLWHGIDGCDPTGR